MTKRILSIIIALAFAISLLPTVAFAAEGVVTLNFLETTKTTTDGVDYYSGTNFNVIKSPNDNVNWYGMVKTADKKNFYFGMAMAGSMKTWQALNDAKYTIEADFSSAGYYDISLSAGKYKDGAAFYVYVNNEYAGMFNCLSPDGQYEDVAEQFKTLYITPSTEGKVKIDICYAGSGSPNVDSYYAKTYINKITFTPNNSYVAPTFDKIVDNIPDVMNVGDELDVSAYVNMSNGVLKTNNFNYDGSNSTSNFVDVEILNNAESAITLVDELGEAFKAYYRTAANYGSTYHTLFNGTYKGKLTAAKAGIASIKITAIVNGEDVSVTKNIEVLDSASPKVLQFNKLTMTNTYSGKYLPMADWVIKANWQIVIDKCSGSSSHQNNTTWFRVDLRPVGGALNWTAVNSAGAAKFTVKTRIAKEGWYKPSFTGGTFNRNCLANIYVDGQFIGNYNAYDAAVTKDGNVVAEQTTFNPVYITPDADGYAEIAFANADWSQNQNYYLTLSEFKLTPVATAEVPTLSSVEFVAESLGTISNGNEVELAQDASVNFTANAKMSDGTIWKYNGLNIDKTADTTISVSVTGSAVKYTGTSNIKSEEFTGKLTAVEPGTSTVTVTAKIGDTTKTTSAIITVPGATEPEPELPGEAADSKVSLYVAAENGGSVSVTGGNGNPVDSIDVGTKITATAGDVTGKIFSHWRNAAGKFMSGEKKYSFVANTNTAIIAVYDDAEVNEDIVSVSFFNQHKALIGSKKVSKGTSFESAKSGIDTSLTGYVFDKWSISDDTVINSLTRAVALYNVAETTYTAYFVDEATGANPIAKTGKYSDAVSYKASGENFSYWVVNDGSNRIVSYDAEISFRLWADIALKAVYNDAKAAVPTIVLDEENGSYFIAYIIPAGYTPVSAGIVFAKSGTPAVNSCYSRAVSEKVSNQGQFTARPNGTESVARGYLMFKDSDNNIRVIYAE